MNIEGEAKLFVVRNVRYISEHILQGSKQFLIGKTQYNAALEESICDLLIKIEEVERVAPCEEGIYVFIH